MTKTNESITYQILNMGDNNTQSVELWNYDLAIVQLNRYRKANPDNRYRLIKITRITLEEFTQD